MWSNVTLGENVLLPHAAMLEGMSLR
jgi:hypothetical protein